MTRFGTIASDNARWGRPLKLKLVILTLVVATFALVVGARALRADNTAKNLKKAIKHYRRASGLVDKGKLDKAIAEYREALRLQPDDAYWHLALALALMQKGYREQARDELQLAKQLAPGLHGPSERMLDEMQRRRAGQPVPASETGGVHVVGGDVTPPVPLYKPEPPYSGKARLASYQGTTILSLVVDAQGNVSDIAVVKPLGVGLDEKAVQTLSTWRFGAATRGGVPARVRVLVEVSFKLY
jgi:TonB family protein